ncbi:MAG: FtsX-like permease family protein [Rhodanobacteraceae bacterium]|jgi:ABC-type lipoprotein release transport system permease subunit|nr:FtsX-like permease family protein [Rhodanobacteraceae bacterium]
MVAARIAGRGIVEAPGRTAYLALILTLATVAWITLSVLAAPFLPTRQSNPYARVAVAVNSASAGQPLPLRYVKRIESLPGVKAVVYSIVLAVVCRDNAPTASIQAFGGSSQAILDLPLWPEGSLQLDALQKRWLSDPMAVLVGAQTAKDCEWHDGRSISPRNFFTGRPIDIHIAGILPAQEDPIANIISIGHYDYLNRAMGMPEGSGSVREIVVLPNDPHEANMLAARIEEAFAHDDPPIEATTGATLQNALARYGQVQNVLGYVMLATFLCTALVLVSVLAHTVMQRRALMALMQVLGFSRGILLRAFALEGLLIVLIGAALGIGFGLLLLRLLPRGMSPFFGNFAVPAWAWSGLPVWLGALWIAALVVPSLTIARLRPIDMRTA